MRALDKKMGIELESDNAELCEIFAENPERYEILADEPYKKPVEHAKKQQEKD